MRNTCCLLLFCLVCQCSNAQVRPNTTVETFKKTMRLPRQTTIQNDIIACGTSFLGKPYPKKAHANTPTPTHIPTPNKPHEKEVLVVNLQQFDCVTFCESMLALALTRRDTNAVYRGEMETFRRKLTLIRYRNGQVDYATRLHYFSDWIFQHQQDSILKDQTQVMDGILYDKKINYMTTKRDTLYSDLSDTATLKMIQLVEKNINVRPKWFIPKAQVASIESQLREGDLIAITTTAEGLDIAHTGFAIRVSGRMHLLHASSQFGQVVISGEPLSDYLLRNAGQSGIMVARIL